MSDRLLLVVIFIVAVLLSVGVSELAWYLAGGS